MDRRLKERLLGATVLVVAAVIVIPWLLRGKQNEDPVSQQLELPRPAAGSSDTRTVRLDVERPEPAAVETAPVAAADSEALPEQPANESSEDSPASDSQVVRDASADATSDVAETWAVQIGSFSKQSNAQRLAERLISLDYPAFVTRNVVEGRVMFRVKVGPEKTRAQADELAVRLREDKHPGRVVTHP